MVVHATLDHVHLVSRVNSLRLARAVGLRLEVLGGEGEAEEESEGVGVAVDAGGVQGRPPLHRQHGDEEREAAQEQLHNLKETRRQKRWNYTDMSKKVER